MKTFGSSSMMPFPVYAKNSSSDVSSGKPFSPDVEPKVIRRSVAALTDATFVNADRSNS